MGSHAEKDYVIKLGRYLDGLLVGANLFESTPGATASLLVRLRARDTKVYVDPMTYAFGAYADKNGVVQRRLDWIRSEQVQKVAAGGKKKVWAVKRSYRRLAEALGSPLAEAVESGQSISPADFGSRAVLESFCRRVLEYQRDRIAREFGEDEDLVAFVGDAPRASALFAPYFYVERSNTDEWWALNESLIRTSTRIDVGVPVHGVVCADVRHLDDSAFLERIVSLARDSGLAGLWLWFSGFLEESVSRVRLERYANLVKDLAGETEVHSLHGGLFSLALSSVGMAGISHGVGYGEQKDVRPVIGKSVPTVRYYLPPIARRLGIPEIERAFDDVGIQSVDDFYESVCGCAVCRGVVSSSLSDFSAFGEMHFSRPDATRQAQTPAAAKRCRFHFLLARLKERNDLRAMSPAQIIEAWEAASRAWGAQPSLKKAARHLGRWIEVLRAVVR